jgi:hypothetical protein
MGSNPFTPESIAKTRGTTTLPNNRMTDWLATVALPEQSCLALISNANAGNITDLA